MSYVDTSFLAPLFKVEERRPAVRRFFAIHASSRPTISQWTQVEFASVVAKDVRMERYPYAQPAGMNAAFERFATQTCRVVDVSRQDFDLARRCLADHGTGLRAGNALHLAIATNAGSASIYSLDKTMIVAGRSLGLPMNVGFPAAD